MGLVSSLSPLKASKLGGYVSDGRSCLFRNYSFGIAPSLNFISTDVFYAKLEMITLMKKPLGFILCFFCSLTFSQMPTNLEEALNSPSRPVADQERDQNRNPTAVLNFLGVESGDNILDVIAMGGWYSEILSLASGPLGKVYMHNNPIPITERTTNERAERTSRLENLVDYVGRIGSLPENSVDFAITALNFHDVYNRSPDEANQLLTDIYDTLKPGGVLGIIDHKGSEGLDNVALHRITFEDAVEASMRAGFVLTGTSRILENLNDDHVLPPFDSSLERNTDRFILRLEKPIQPPVSH